MPKLLSKNAESYWVKMQKLLSKTGKLLSKTVKLLSKIVKLLSKVVKLLSKNTHVKLLSKACKVTE